MKRKIFRLKEKKSTVNVQANMNVKMAANSKNQTNSSYND